MSKLGTAIVAPYLIKDNDLATTDATEHITLKDEHHYELSNYARSISQWKKSQNYFFFSKWHLYSLEKTSQ